MMAPEILNGDQYDSRVDVWSLGISLLLLVEPDNPLFKLTPINGFYFFFKSIIFHIFLLFLALFVVSTGEPPKLVKKYPASFEKFMKRCLVKEPKDRSFANELVQHPFILSVQTSKKNILQELAKRFFGKKEKNEETVEETVIEDEEVIRVYLPNRTFRCLLVRYNETCKDVIEKVNLKCGFIFSGVDFKLHLRYNNKGFLTNFFYFLLFIFTFFFQKISEKILSDETNIISLLREHVKDGDCIFFLQKLPQTTVITTFQIFLIFFLKFFFK